MRKLAILIALLVLLVPVAQAQEEETYTCDREEFNSVVLMGYEQYGDSVWVHETPETDRSDLRLSFAQEQIPVLGYTRNEQGTWLLIAVKGVFVTPEGRRDTYDSNVIVWAHEVLFAVWCEGVIDLRGDDILDWNEEHDMVTDLGVPEIPAFEIPSYAEPVPAYAFGSEINLEGWEVEIPSGVNLRSGPWTGFGVTDVSEEVTVVSHIRYRFQMADGDWIWYGFINDGELVWVAERVTNSVTDLSDQ